MEVTLVLENAVHILVACGSPASPKNSVLFLLLPLMFGIAPPEYLHDVFSLTSALYIPYTAAIGVLFK